MIAPARSCERADAMGRVGPERRADTPVGLTGSFGAGAAYCLPDVGITRRWPPPGPHEPGLRREVVTARPRCVAALHHGPSAVLRLRISIGPPPQGIAECWPAGRRRRVTASASMAGDRLTSAGQGGVLASVPGDWLPGSPEVPARRLPGAEWLPLAAALASCDSASDRCRSPRWPELELPRS